MFGACGTGDANVLCKTRDLSDSFNPELMVITGHTMSPKPRRLHRETANNRRSQNAGNYHPVNMSYHSIISIRAKSHQHKNPSLCRIVWHRYCTVVFVLVKRYIEHFRGSNNVFSKNLYLIEFIYFVEPLFAQALLWPSALFTTYDKPWTHLQQLIPRDFVIPVEVIQTERNWKNKKYASHKRCSKCALQKKP